MKKKLSKKKHRTQFLRSRVEKKQKRSNGGHSKSSNTNKSQSNLFTFYKSSREKGLFQKVQVVTVILFFIKKEKGPFFFVCVSFGSINKCLRLSKKMNSQ